MRYQGRGSDAERGFQEVAEFYTAEVEVMDIIRPNQKLE